ncbi:MAG: toll/interleukin-1 receptor domain-containing protein [Hellea sp.]
MYTVIQIPIFDPRGLEPIKESPKNLKPGWPAPDPAREFIRSFGGVFERSKGGLQGFFAESFLCNAKRAIRFPYITGHIVDDGSEHGVFIKPRIATRHFYFDGYCTGKFEIGFFMKSPTEKNAIAKNGHRDFAKHLLRQSVKIPIGPILKSTELIHAGKSLALSYEQASVNRKKVTDEDRNKFPERRFFNAGTPLVSCKIDGPVKLQGLAYKRTAKLNDCVIYSWSEKVENRLVEFLLIQDTDSKEYQDLSRNLRFFLNRIHAELTAIQFALTLIAKRLQSDDLTESARDKIHHNLNRIETEQLKKIRLLSDRVGKAARVLLRDNKLEKSEIGDAVLSALWGSRIDSVKARFDLLRRQATDTAIVHGAGILSLAALNIFISYRRNDTAEITHKFKERLQSYFPKATFYYDVESIEPGTEWRPDIVEAMVNCDYALAMIGDEWVGASSVGSRRIDDPDDVVRLELEIALEKGVKILPIMVDGPKFPSRLPESLKPVLAINAHIVKADAPFDVEAKRLGESVLGL